MSVHGGGARGRVCAGHRTAASGGAEPGPAYRQPRYGVRNDLYTQGLARGDPFSRKVTRFGITKFLRSAGSGFAAAWTWPRRVASPAGGALHLGQPPPAMSRTLASPRLGAGGR